jgi:hypothetical protein
MRSLLLLLALSPFLTTACARTQTPTNGTPPLTVPEGATELTVEPVEEIVNRFYSGIGDRRRVVVQTTEDWHALWAELTILQVPQPDPPGIDFDREMVIVATMGRQSTGGYLITIPTVHEHEGPGADRTGHRSQGRGPRPAGDVRRAERATELSVRADTRTTHHR